LDSAHFRVSVFHYDRKTLVTPVLICHSMLPFARVVASSLAFQSSKLRGQGWRFCVLFSCAKPPHPHVCAHLDRPPTVRRSHVPTWGILRQRARLDKFFLFCRIGRFTHEVCPWLRSLHIKTRPSR
jgi:hypothetical protein